MGNPISAQLFRLDALLEREILRLRARYQLSLDEFRGLYVSDEQVDRLVSQTRDPPSTAPVTEDPVAGPAAGARLACAAWRHIAEAFGLSPLEEDLLLLAAAPELDLKYETLYAYLNNDVTRKWPTADLARRVLTDPEATAGALAPGARLFRLHLCERIDPPSGRPGLLNSGFALRPPIASCLRGLAPFDPRFASTIRLTRPDLSDGRQLSPSGFTLLRRLSALCLKQRDPKPVLLFAGPQGSGRRAMAQALANELRLPMCSVDLHAIQGTPGLDELLTSLELQLTLEPALLHFEGLDALCRDDGRPGPGAGDLQRALGRLRVPVVVTAGPDEPWRTTLGRLRSIEIRFGQQGYGERVILWQGLLEAAGLDLGQADLRALADRFVLTEGQIRDAIASAQDLQVVSGGSAQVGTAELARAARFASDQDLGRMAQKIEGQRGWDDLVLPPYTLTRLRELSAAVRYRHLVYSEWGFGERSAAAGVKAMFAGPSGTGKTMAAGVIARELALDLYKIDLSGVVSKYIGETEKNLDRIFRAARSSNAILFFDEAEAILGKRSEVKDAHDRYANIEVAYLLQKLEEHEGVVILATNLRRNIDDAFNRRMQFVIDFPRPNEAEREQLWRRMFPPQAPLGHDVDFRFLAKQFDLPGGDIRNVVLDAAFLAAQNGGVIDMRCVVESMARQLAKQGKTATSAEFRHYQGLLAEGDRPVRAA